MADTQEIKNLVHNILSVDGLPSTAYKKANKIHLGIVMLAILGGLIVLIEMILNYNGIRSTQIYIGLILNFILIFYFTRPKLLPLMYIKKARFVIAHILLFCTTMSLLLYVVSIRSNPHMVPALFLLGLAVIYIDCVYNINSKTYKRLTILLVYATAILTFVAIPSRATYMKWIGVYPLEVIYTSDLEESVSELETLQNKVDEGSKKSRIDYFIWKVKEGKSLDDNEKAEYKKIKEDLNREKVPHAINSAVDKISDTAEKLRLIAENAKLRADVEEATKKAAEEATKVSDSNIATSLPFGVTQVGDLVTVNEECTFSFHVKPYQALSNRYKLGDGIYLHVSTSKIGDHFSLQYDDETSSFVRKDKKGFEKSGIVRPINGNNETTMTLHFSRDA